MLWESIGQQGDQTNSKGNQSWIFIGRTDVEAPTSPPDAKNWLIGNDPDAGKDWRQEEGMTEDEMVGWHHRLYGQGFEQAPGVGDGQGSLACCSPWGCKKLDTTELNWYYAIKEIKVKAITFKARNLAAIQTSVKSSRTEGRLQNGLWPLGSSEGWKNLGEGWKYPASSQFKEQSYRPEAVLSFIYFFLGLDTYTGRQLKNAKRKEQLQAWNIQTCTSCETLKLLGVDGGFVSPGHCKVIINHWGLFN